MVEVRIRLESDAQSKRLGEVPFTSAGLDGALRLVREWGLASDGDDYNTVFGQFVLTSYGAYFELVAPDGDK